MTKRYSVHIYLEGDITYVENNIDMVVSSIDFMGLDDCHIYVSDLGMAVEEGASDDA